jgi:hypothetical protein
MAHERKAGESASSKARSPVPISKKDDLEDVAWALQTAETTWSRGEHADALKWIRRAAEAASEAEADDRALELAKAAADVASLLAEKTSVTVTAPQGAMPAIPAAPRITSASRPPPALYNPPPSPRPPGVAAPTAPKVGGGVPALPRPGQKGPIPSRVQAPAPMSKRGGRRSSPSFTDEMTHTEADVRAPSRSRASVTNEAKKRARNSKPAADDTQQGPATSRHPSVAEEIDAWPTQTLTGDDFDDEAQHTRIGTPAYRETAKKASARPPAMGAPGPLVTSQAVRVVVWREADGVHVAPAGTQVTAISVEAVLVAMDPGADLAAWLSNK